MGRTPPPPSSSPSRPSLVARFLDASPYALAFLVALAVGITTTVALRDELIRLGTKHAGAYGARARATIVAVAVPRRAGPDAPVDAPENVTAVKRGVPRETERCKHGYRTASHSSGGCVCRHGYGGDACDEDLIPSCDRTVMINCNYVLTNWGEALPRHSCACVNECAKAVRDAFGIRESSPIWKDYLREKRDNDAVCDTENGTVWNWKKKEILAGYVSTAKSSRPVVLDTCMHNCFGQGDCVERLCECKEGRYGALCQFNASEVAIDVSSLTHERVTDRVTSIEYYDALPAFARVPLFTHAYYFDTKSEGLDKRRGRIEASVYTTAIHFAETLVEERWKGVLTTPRGGTHRFIPFFSAQNVGNLGFVRPWIQIIAANLPKNDRSEDPWYILSTSQDRGLCSSIGARQALPEKTIVLSSFGWHKYPRRDNASSTPAPRDAQCFRPDRDIVIPAVRPGVRSVLHEYEFNPDMKNGSLLFFKGGTRIYKDNKCVGEGLFDPTNDCQNVYSQGMREYITTAFHDVPEFDVHNLTDRTATATRDQFNRDAMITAKYCLSAGGHGFDMRLFDSVARGCVPLLTAQDMSYPFDIVLDYEKFAIVINDRGDRLRKLPETLKSAYERGDHPDMVKRLRYVHETFAMSDEFTDANLRDFYNVTDGGFATAITAIGMRTGTKIPELIKKTMCHLAYEFHEGRGHEIFKPEALDYLACKRRRR